MCSDVSDISGRAARQYITLNARTESTFGYLKIVCRLKVHPVLRGGSEVTGQAHGGIGSNRALAIDNGADPVHGNAQITRELIQTDFHVAKILKEDFSGMNGWKLFS
jgi:hypothetical protein